MDDIAGAGETMADIELHNEHLLRVAKDQGRQGNVVYDNTTGKLAIMDEFACGGEADLYQWGQNNWEVHLRIYVMTDTGKRDVKLHTTTQSIRLEVDGLVFSMNCTGQSSPTRLRTSSPTTWRSAGAS